MALEILSAPKGVDTDAPQYRLPSTVRETLRLAGSNSGGTIPAETLIEIEQQRIAFAAKNGGCSFGTN